MRAQKCRKTRKIVPRQAAFVGGQGLAVSRKQKRKIGKLMRKCGGIGGLFGRRGKCLCPDPGRAELAHGREHLTNACRINASAVMEKGAERYEGIAEKESGRALVGVARGYAAKPAEKGVGKTGEVGHLEKEGRVGRQTPCRRGLDADRIVLGHHEEGAPLGGDVARDPIKHVGRLSGAGGAKDESDHSVTRQEANSHRRGGRG